MPRPSLADSHRASQQPGEVPQHKAGVHRVAQRVESVVGFAIAEFRRKKILIGRKAANQIARLQIAPRFVQNAGERRGRRGEERQSQAEQREPRVFRQNGGELRAALHWNSRGVRRGETAGEARRERSNRGEGRGRRSRDARWRSERSRRRLWRRRTRRPGASSAERRVAAACCSRERTCRSSAARSREERRAARTL